MRSFADELGHGLTKPGRRFLNESIYGLIRARSTHLTKIGQELLEPCELDVTENRLSRQLASPRMDESSIVEAYQSLATKRLERGSWTVSVDTTDIVKPRAQKMPFLARIRDGSKKVTANGWEVLAIEAVGSKGKRMPLRHQLYSHQHPSYISANDELDRAIGAVRPGVPDKCVWAFDSGFEGRLALDVFHKHDLNFVVRMDVPGVSVYGDIYEVNAKPNHRKLYIDGERLHIGDAAAKRPSKGNMTVTRLTELDKGERRKKRWTFGVSWSNDVYLLGRSKSGKVLGKGERKYSIVFIYRNQQPPMAVLTNIHIKNINDARKVMNHYFDRWAIEETFRFLKSGDFGFRMEDVRVLSWRGLRRMSLLVMLAYAYLCLLHLDGHGERIARYAKAIGREKIPLFLYYRLAQALRFVSWVGPGP